MQHIYLLKGLNCAHCAGKIEDNAKKLAGVQEAELNFAVSKLIMESELECDELFSKIRKIVNDLEPDVKVSAICSHIKKHVHHEHHEHEHHHDCDCEHEHHHDHDCCCGHDHDHDHDCGCEHDHHHDCSCGHEHCHDHHHEHALDELCACGHDHGHSHDHGENNGKRLLIRLSLGLLLCALTFLPVFSGTILRVLLFVCAYLIFGADIIISAVRGIFKGRVFDENFLMTVASVGAMLLGEYAEACAVMGLYQVGEYFQDKAVARSRRSIADLTNIRADHANVIRGGSIVSVSPDEVEIGETIVINPFERVPLDGECVFGESFLDTSALTGESVPRRIAEGDQVLSGCVNQNGIIRVKVNKLAGDSMADRVLSLIEGASAKKAPTEKFITKFSRYYTPIVTAAAVLLGVIPSLITGQWSVWIERALTFLVVSCPCAIVISVPLSYFGGIGKASKSGVLIKGAGYLDALTNITDIVFDKTGTLTKGEFAVRSIKCANGFTEEQVLYNAACAESASSHPIAKSITAACGEYEAAQSVNERPGFGVSAVVSGKKVLCGGRRLLEEQGVAFEYAASGGSDVLVAIDGVFAGVIVISDMVKTDAGKAVSELKSLGIRSVHMLTGDNEQAARQAAGELGIDNVLFELLPQNKLEALENIMKAGLGKCAYVGDGINDAPVIARADVGIAMGALGSDAALEAADMVLMDDNPQRIADAIRIARKTGRIVKQNIAFALLIKVLILLLSAMGITSMWLAVFADVGVALLCVLNSIRTIK